jgi:hypothetical protein
VPHHGGVSDEEPRPEEQTAPILPPDRPPATEESPQRWRDRAWSLRAVIAVGLVAVVLGGLAGAAIASVGGHQDQRGGPGFGRFHGGPGMPPGQGRMGQRPQWRFNDPRGSGQRQWDQQQQPGGPNGPPQRDNHGNNPTPAPPTPSPTR